MTKPGCLVAVVALCVPACARATAARQAAVPDGCLPLIAAAEAEHGIPTGFLRAIAVVESGRAGPDGRVAPWPWTINANNRSLFFASRDEAVRWTRAALAGGEDSIDVGCMQVNLHFHPAAFPTLEAAFDPHTNVRYAARFLSTLRASSRDWMEAGGRYHSYTPALAEQYRVQIAGNYAPPAAPVARGNPALHQLALAWKATLPDAGADGTGAGHWTVGP